MTFQLYADTSTWYKKLWFYLCCIWVVVLFGAVLAIITIGNLFFFWQRRTSDTMRSGEGGPYKVDYEEQRRQQK